ncbi:hypothetical protein HYU07_06555 [Candidatus Woesearchaeota archaeon]|nr:hypothetical protein [Candidatus Woesearchaeota archaeon]
MRDKQAQVAKKDLFIGGYSLRGIKMLLTEKALDFMMIFNSHKCKKIDFGILEENVRQELRELEELKKDYGQHPLFNEVYRRIKKYYSEIEKIYENNYRVREKLFV